MTTALQDSGTVARPTRKPHYQVLSEFALGLVSLSIVVGFGRVFNDASFLGPLTLVVVLTHVFLATVRRRNWGIALSGLVGIIGLALVCTYLFFASSTRFLLPSGATITQLRDALSSSWNTFQNVTAPAPAETGFLLACAVALFFAVFLADWAAFRLWSPWEAIVPATTLFVFCSLLGSIVNRVPATALFVAAALAFILVHSVAKRETSAGWLSADVDRGSRALLRVGVALGLVAALSGVVIGPFLPGADSDAVVCFSKCAEGAHAGDRFTISPLVEIQSRLIDQANVELFTVQSPTKAYWRMTSLDTFDGNSWRSKGKFTVADGDLNSSLAPTDNTLVDQQYHISALARLWIPAAFQPVHVSADAKARYQSDSATLIVDTDLDTSDGLSYDVQSKIPSFDPDQLRQANPTIPSDIADRYLALPNDFSLKAQTAAKAQTDGKVTNYDKALALQDWFRSEFTYNLKVPPGHSDRAIDDFLDRRQGYCEQFAGTFAAMARSLGIPARVAVGFTWGESDPNTPNLYHVRGDNAHAWPEVYLGQYGWVAFEPTPGRGDPSNTRYTGVNAQQATQDGTPSSTSSTATTSTVPGGPPTTTPPSPLDPNGLPDQVDTSSGSSVDAGFWASWLGKAAIVALLLVPVALIYIVAVIWLPERRRRKRRERARDPSSQVQVAWQESVEDLSVVGVARVSAETNDEFASRAGGQLPETAQVISVLARDADAAMYAQDLVDASAVERARSGATSINLAVRSHSTTGRRLKRALDPRRLRSPRTKGTPRHRATSDDR
jgi:hypothetical protein